MNNNLYKNTFVKSNNIKNSYIDKKNNSNSFHKEEKSPLDINKKINKLFKSSAFVYKLNLTIVINGKTFNEEIIAKNDEYLLTINNKRIYYKDIEDIYTNN